MSINKFSESVKESIKEDRLLKEKCVKELVKELPDKDTDDSDTVLYWKSSNGWSQLIEDELEDAGYSISYMQHLKTFRITFSDDTIKEIEDERNNNRIKQLDEREEKKRKIENNLEIGANIRDLVKNYEGRTAAPFYYSEPWEAELYMDH